MGRTAFATVVHVRSIHAFVSQDINGMISLSLVWISTSAPLAPTIACHRPDASIHQGRIIASVLPLWGGPLMAKAATILMNASTLMSATHKPRASTTQEDLTAVAT